MRLAVLVLGIALVGCANTLVKKTISVEPGMSRQQVTAILGAPQDRQFQGKNEAWQYCELGATAGDFVIVWFYDGRVTGLRHWTDSSPAFTCTALLRPVRWEDRPDSTIEVRQR